MEIRMWWKYNIRNVGISYCEGHEEVCDQKVSRCWVALWAVFTENSPKVDMRWLQHCRNNESIISLLPVQLWLYSLTAAFWWGGPQCCRPWTVRQHQRRSLRAGWGGAFCWYRMEGVSDAEDYRVSTVLLVPVRLDKKAVYVSELNSIIVFTLTVNIKCHSVLLDLSFTSLRPLTANVRYFVQ